MTHHSSCAQYADRCLRLPLVLLRLRLPGISFYPVLVLVLVSVAGTIAAACRPAPPRLQPAGAVTAFVDVAVVPMDTDRVVPHQTVLVQGGRIAALGPVARVVIPAGAIRIDGRRKFLIPGLADMHVHLWGDSVASERALFLFVANGITTVRNMNYQSVPVSTWTDSNYQHQLRANAFLLRLRARAAAGTLVSPRIYTSGPWGPRQYIQFRSPNTDPPPKLDSIAAYVAAYKAAGYDFVKIHNETAVVAESVAAAAHRVGIPVAGHADIITVEGALAAGFASIEHMTGYEEKVEVLRRARVLDTSRIRALAMATRRAGVWNCPTAEGIFLFTQDKVTRDTAAQWPELRYASPEVLSMWKGNYMGVMSSVRSATESPEAVVQLIRALQTAGAGLLSGTDVSDKINPLFAFMVPGYFLHRELAALVHAGLTPYQVLAASTRNGAVFFGTLSESGTVAVGKRADLVLLNGNPLVDIRNTTGIAGVMLGGRWFPHAALEPRLVDELKAYLSMGNRVVSP